MKYLHFSILSFLILCTLSCKSNKQNGPTQLDVKPGIISFVDSAAASTAIINEDIDGYFDQLSVAEMQIQMKKNFPNQKKEDVKKAYLTFLKKQVSDWTTDEKLKMQQLFKSVKSLCDTLSPRIFPGGMKLIKVKTNHFGNDVYYTSGKNIMIPENIFNDFSPERQLPVMIHETFHILSRYNSSLRNELYSYIGFQKAEKPIQLNASLEAVLLNNPDGVSYQYAIDLEKDGSMIKAIPLITSKSLNYDTKRPNFFDYLQFDLYSLDDKGSHYVAKSTTTGETLLPLQSTPNFFTKIKDNTQYIIHPDEIMADNFMLALLAYDKNEYGKFSKDGKILIQKILDKLKTL